MRTLQLGLLSGLLLGLLSPLVVSAQSGTAALGKLFYSPEERRWLEARAQARPLTPSEIVQAAQTQAKVLQPDVLHYNGIARRDGGAPIVWINGARVAESVQLDGQILVVPGSGQRLRPGQNSAAPGPALPGSASNR